MGMKEYFTSLSLPDSAVKVNGAYLEKTIIGYRTNSVKGREPMSVDITELTVGNANGAKYQRKRDNTRTLQLSFILVADTMSEYHALMNKLKSILNTPEQQYIFKDEPDVYYVGTVESIEADPIFYMEALGCAGTISIHCADPYKYSVEEKEYEATLDDGYTFGIDYKGTYPTDPKFEITMNGDNGFVGLLDQSGHILEFGTVDEADGETKTKSEQLATLTDLINAKNDVGGYDVMHPLYGTNGTLTTATWFSNTFLKFGSTGTKKGSASGGLRTFTLPADSNGEKGCTNWYSYFHVLFYAGAMGQTGEMSVSFLTDDNKIIAGYNWYKTDTTGNTGAFDFVVYNPNKKSTDAMGGRVLKTFKYTTSHLKTQNPWYWDWGHCDLRKEGSKITFFYWGKYYSFTIPEIANLVCTKVQFSVKQWGDRSGNKFMQYAGMNRFYIQKLNVPYWVDSPNLFSKDDKLEVDVSKNEVLLNGLNKIGIGKIANDWDDFQLQPGQNQIKVTCSEWATKPTMKIKYREVFL